MSSSTSKQLGSNTAPTERSPLRRAIYFAVFMAFLAVPMFVAAGRLDWWGGWAFMGAYIGGGMVGTLVVSHLNPEVMQARAERHEGTKRWDRVLMSVYALMCLLTTVVAGLDAGRYGWSPPIPLALRIVAIVVLEISQGLTDWAVVANAHFEKTVRIQNDRGQRVCTSGPYRFVRHPGYLGYIITWISAPLIMGSWWALIPAGLSGVLFIVRTALEDRTLHAELIGYGKYAQQTRYRLLPGIW